MIKNSFIFLQKVSKRKEQAIWSQGIKDWTLFLKKDKIKGISNQKKEYYNRIIVQANKALYNNQASFFVNKLPKVQMWRLYNYFKEEIGFLDVEVDSYGKIILVGISNYYDTNMFVKGVNLEYNLLKKELSKFKIIITFNGAAFDLPKLKKEFNLNFNTPHIDLKPLCINLGLKGGLKQVEKILNLKRPKHLNGNPVDLWKAFHASGDREYLELLIDYNKEDCENLKGIMDYVYKKNYSLLKQ
jgi:uncharacterized protein